MFILKSKYDTLNKQYLELQNQYIKKSNSLEQYNDCIDMLRPCIFNTGELNRLINMIHPDKHNNSEKSNELTTIVLEKREKTKELLKWINKL